MILRAFDTQSKTTRPILLNRGPYLKVADVAVQLGLGERSVRRLIETGSLPAIRMLKRILRVGQMDVDAYLDKP